MSLFDEYGIDPHAGLDAITERFRELMEDARDEEARDALRKAWETLTLHPVDRWRAALQTHPETPAPPAQPSRSEQRPPLVAADFERHPPTFADLVAGPRVSFAFAMLDATPPAEPRLLDDPTLTGEGE